MALAATALIVVPALAAVRHAPEATPPSLQSAGIAFEQARLLTGVDRLAALEQTEQSVEQVLHHGGDSNRRATASFLAGAVHYELGNYVKASDAFDKAGADGKGPFADDAAFAAIQSLEAAGRDADAAREW